MVVFTCNYCGESLHKPKVEKHYQFTCRSGKSMTCVDCLKDFREDYVGHTKCVTEEERYAAKGTYKNGIVKKGESKQESWVEMIGNIVEQDKTLTGTQRNIFNSLSQYPNIPRKKNKFINFMISSSGRKMMQKDIEDVWNIIEKYKATNAHKNGKQNGNSSPQKRPLEEEKSENLVPKKSKKLNFEEIVPETPEERTLAENENSSTKFSFEGAILDILSKKETISLKKLDKKVRKKYLKSNQEIVDSEKFQKKIHKKLKKMENVTVDDDNVTLLRTS